jgi:hypothetical protein
VRAVRSTSSQPWALSASLPLLAALGAALLVGRSTTETAFVLIAGLAMAVAGTVAVPGSPATAPTPALAVAASLPLLARDGTPVFDGTAIAAVVCIGLAALWVVRTARGDDPWTVSVVFLRRAATIGVYGALFAWTDRVLAPGLLGDWRPFLVFLPAAVGAFVVDAWMAALAGRGIGSGSFWFRVRVASRQYDRFTIIVATGALFGLAFEGIGWWALPVAILPYAFAHGAFRRFATAKRTYAQTIRALSRIPEVGGHTTIGHAERTASLATEVAAELGLGPGSVEEVEYVAFMHDIGRVTLNEPSVARSDPSEAELARWGAEIVGEAVYLRRVAEAVRRRHEPYRNPGEERDPDLPMAARIVKVCSAYDEAIEDRRMSPLEAVERLHEGTVYDLDPEVVGAVRRVLQRRGAFVGR